MTVLAFPCGGGLNYGAPSLVLTVDAKARGLVVHDETGYHDWCASRSVRIESHASSRGLSPDLAPAWGAGGVEWLWSLAVVRDRASGAGATAPENRLRAELGCNFPCSAAGGGDAAYPADLYNRRHTAPT